MSLATAVVGDIHTPFQLRDYQTEAINAVVEYFARLGHNPHRLKNPLIVLPTGAGKGVLQAGLIERLEVATAGLRVLFLTHSKELIEQNHDKFCGMLPGFSAGIHSASLKRRNLGDRFLFAGIQSIYRKAKALGHYDLVIIDEAHLVPHDGFGMYRTLLLGLRRTNPDIKIVGLTATPFRLNHGLLTEGKDRIFSDIVYQADMLRLIEEGYLCPMISRGSLHHADLSRARIEDGEFVEADAESAMLAVTAAALDEACHLGADRNSWLVFASSVKHAQDVRDGMVKRGISAEVITSETPKHDRERWIEDFKSRRLRALVNVNVLTTGFDFSGVDLIISLRPTLSAGLWMQICGRGMRPDDCKTDCLVLDYAGNISRHGPLDLIAAYDKRRRAGGGQPLRECGHCGSKCHIALTECPECSHALPAPKLKLTAESSTQDLLSSVTTSKPVVDQRFTVQANVLHVEYTLGLTYKNRSTSREEVSFDGGAAPRKWWQTMGGLKPIPSTAMEALERITELSRPLFLTLKRSGQNERIVGYQFHSPALAA